MGDRPRLAELVPDALVLDRRQRVVALGRPVLPLVGFVVAAGLGWWPAAIAMVAVVFVSTVVVLHDLFHHNLGLGPRTNGVLLGAYGALLLNSGHALARSHLQHHRVYPDRDDPEAYVDGWPVWRVVLEGPRYRFRVWAWAWRHGTRRLLVVEMAVWAAAWLVAMAVPAVLVYVVTAEVGSWTFPLLSVTGVHDRHAPGPLQQSRTFRGPGTGLLMLGMQHHLEHHLYPRVPAARLGEVARALDPWLRQHDATILTIGRLGARP